MKYWLIKSEPDVYSFEDLKRDRKTCWDGIRNYQARNLMRDEMTKGDLCLFYHSRTKPMAAVGICRVASKAAYPDPTQFDPNDAHHDPKSDPDDPRWLMVDVAYVKAFKQPVTLETMRGNPDLAEMALLRRGNRLSIQPVTKKEFATVCRLGGIAPP